MQQIMFLPLYTGVRPARCSHCIAGAPLYARSQTNQQKSILPPPGFSPVAITCPGGIEGRGVISQTRARGVSLSQCAAFRRAVGKIIATCSTPSRDSALTAKCEAVAKGGLQTMTG